MSTFVDFSETGSTSSRDVGFDDSRINIRDREDARAVAAANTIGIQNIGPHSTSDTSLSTEIVEPKDAKALRELNTELGVVVAKLASLKTHAVDQPETKEKWTNIALLLAEVTIKVEADKSNKLREETAKIEKHQNNIETLLKLSAELKNYKAGEPLPRSILDITDELLANGIDLKIGDKLTEAQLAGTKSLSSSHIEQFKAKIQMAFTAQVNPLIQILASLINSNAATLRAYDASMRTIVGNQKPR